MTKTCEHHNETITTTIKCITKNCDENVGPYFYSRIIYTPALAITPHKLYLPNFITANISSLLLKLQWKSLSKISNHTSFLLHDFPNYSAITTAFPVNSLESLIIIGFISNRECCNLPTKLRKNKVRSSHEAMPYVLYALSYMQIQLTHECCAQEGLAHCTWIVQ